eukprot:gnl/TRDRNA2_/TRDRNA2_36608_c0_seq1.p1 gnl/TRDRNA2_/TRDRNA2_36608_c0~~gnl/TRDRNA2_/TRDRNA2_36608_c0_seq1.p1  ORF type:complete len:460 (+),score=93.32 gnl/TRDRNA2_/TRDRNA2_36608_c0_seq1:125-1381(+)
MSADAAAAMETARGDRAYKAARREAKTNRKRALEKGDTKPAELIIDTKYTNELPKPPVPKLLRALPSAESLYRYKTTSLELDHRPFLLMERDLLSCVELVDPDAYGKLPAEGSMAPPPPPKDCKLLRDDDISEAHRASEEKKRKLADPYTEAYYREAFGLQLPLLITNDVFTERQRFTTGREAAEKKLDREPPPQQTPEDLERNVEKTFQDAKEAPVHPSNPSMKPKRVLSIVPDAVLWANKYRQVLFDELPHTPVTNDLLFKTVPTPRHTCFGYFSTSEHGEPGSYRLAENYFWENRGGFARSVEKDEGESILFSIPPGNEEGEARFVVAPTWMRLKKQKAHRLDINLETQALSVKHRDPDEKEAAEEQERMNAVLTDEVQVDTTDNIEFIDGEWVATSSQGHPTEATLPLTMGPHE